MPKGEKRSRFAADGHDPSFGTSAVWGSQEVATRRMSRDDRDGVLWRIAVRGESEPFEIEGRFLVDATGRSASLARGLGGERLLLDRLVGVTGILRFDAEVPADTFTLVETCELGCWYSARLPGAGLRRHPISSS